MTTQQKTLVSANIPFAGFYSSWHDGQFDDALEMMFDIEGTGATYAGPLASHFSETINWRGAYADYAKAYAENFANALGLTVCEWEEMVSPREYNFTTDRLFAKFDLSELAALFARPDIRENLNIVAAEMFTSRDGFMSFYSPDVTTWQAFEEWDANQLGALLKAAANVIIADGAEFDMDQEFSLMADEFSNGAIYKWIWDNTTDGAVMGNRCDKIARYLAARESR